MGMSIVITFMTWIFVYIFVCCDCVNESANCPVLRLGNSASGLKMYLEIIFSGAYDGLNE